MATLRAPGARRIAPFFDQAREPTFLLGPRGDFAYVNSAWEALTGRSADDVLGRDGPALEPGIDTAWGFEPPHEALAGTPSGGPALIVSSTGERTWHRIEFWPFHAANGELLGFLGQVRDRDAPPQAVDAESRRAAVELTEAREALRLRFGHAELIGRGPRHLRLLAQVTNAAGLDSPVAIVGEPGTGRRQVARVIHEREARSPTSFLVLDAAALTPGTIDREVLAAGAEATLVIQEPERLPRDLQERLVPLLGDTRIRIMAVTGIEPEAAIADGRFRDDFGYALSALVIRLAPLRDRIEELPLLAQHLLMKVNQGAARRLASFRDDALEVLKLYDWPGNITELARVVSAAHARASGDQITAEDLPSAIRGEFASAYEPQPIPTAITPLDAWLALLETRMIERALARARRNKSRAAELLDISRPRLYRRMKELGIPDDGEANESSNGRESD